MRSTRKWQGRFSPLQWVPLLLIFALPLRTSVAEAEDWEDARKIHYPYVVHVMKEVRYLKYKPLCIGALIKRNYVLTTAACVINKGARYSIVDGWFRYHVNKTIRHPILKESSGTVNNIAILELEREIESNQLFKIVNLPHFQETVEIDRKSIMIRWGLHQQCYKMKTVQNLDVGTNTGFCRNRLKRNKNRILPKVVVCVDENIDFKRFCDDVYLLVQKNGNYTVLIGISAGITNLFAQVSLYVDWINSKIINSPKTDDDDLTRTKPFNENMEIANKGLLPPLILSWDNFNISDATVDSGSQKIDKPTKKWILNEEDLADYEVVLLRPSQTGGDEEHVQVELPVPALLDVLNDNNQVKITFATYKPNEVTFLQNNLSVVRPSVYGTTAGRIVNSDIVSVSLNDGERVIFSEGSFIHILFQLLVTENVGNPTCVYWNFTNNDWSEDGCAIQQSKSNKTHSVCQCNHLTNFAILMDVHGTKIDFTNDFILRIITCVGCSISIVCLGLEIITFQLFQKLKTNVTNIHKNLCICLLMVQALFVGGVEQTSQKLVCGIIARLLHFFLLCAFAWMFIEGLQLYFMLIKVFETGRSRMRWYYLFAYGMPLMVIAIACAINPRGYGTEHYCWLKTTDYFIFSFVGPVIIILVVNFGFLCMAMKVICRRTNKTISANTKDHAQMDSLKIRLKGFMMLVFLLGLTWTFGLLFMNRQTLVMAYIFTALNSLQGLIIFVFHCLLNKTVCKEYQQFIEQYCCEFKNKLMNDNGPTSSSSNSNYRL